MILDVVAVLWWDAKEIFWTKKVPLCSRHVHGPILVIGVTIGNFQRSVLACDYGERLRTLAHRLDVLDTHGI